MNLSANIVCCAHVLPGLAVLPVLLGVSVSMLTDLPVYFFQNYKNRKQAIGKG